MYIPIMPVMLNDDKDAVTGLLSFSGCEPQVPPYFKDFRDIAADVVQRFGKGKPIVMIDVNGMQKKKIDFDLLKKIRIRKPEIWLLSYVEDADDVLDVFYMDMDRVMIPYHAIASDDVLAEINKISDSCIPTVFTNGRDAYTKKGTADVTDVLKRIRERMSSKIAVMDVSGKYDEKMWKNIHSEFDGIIPYVHCTSCVWMTYLEHMGFHDVLMIP